MLRKKWWRVAGSAIFLAVLISRLDRHQLRDAFVRLDIQLWLAAVGLQLAAQVFNSLRWQVLARAIGFGGWWGQYLTYSFIGSFFNLALPTSVGGDVVRMWYLARQGGPSPASGKRAGAFLSVIVDRLSGLWVLLGVAFVASRFTPFPLPSWISLTVAVGGAASLLALFLLLLLPLLRRLPRLPSWTRRERIAQFLKGILLYAQKPRALVLTAVLALGIQLLNVAQAGLIGKGLGLPVPWMFYGILVPLLGLVTLLPVSLNGMGVREAATVLLLAPLEISAGSAVTLAFLTFAASVVASLPGSILYLLARKEGGERASIVAKQGAII